MKTSQNEHVGKMMAIVLAAVVLFAAVVCFAFYKSKTPSDSKETTVNALVTEELTYKDKDHMSITSVSKVVCAGRHKVLHTTFIHVPDRSNPSSSTTTSLLLGSYGSKESCEANKNQ